jgi:hypothetical protein
MFCFACGKKIPADSVFCLYCGVKQVTSGLPDKLEPHPAPSDELSNFDFVIISSRYDQEKSKKDPKIPDWVRKFFPEFEHSVVVWDTELHKSHTFFAFDVLDIIDDWNASNQWKTEGIPVIEKSPHINLPSAYSKKALAAKEKQSDKQIQEKEIFRIKGKDAERFINALNAHKKEFEEMCDEDEERTTTVFMQCYAILINGAQEQEENKIDLSRRQMEWKHEQNFRWTCEKGTFTGIVSTEQFEYRPKSSKKENLWKQISSPYPIGITFNFRWMAEVKSAERDYYQGKRFDHLEEALDWVENEMLTVKDEPVENHPDITEPEEFILTEEYRQKLAPYWIDPSSIEPEHVTYQSLIQLTCKPESSELFTCLSGKKIEINRKYPSPAGLAVKLGLDHSGINFEQIIPDTELYQAVSLTRFYNQQDAVNFAQELWQRSNILKMFHDNIILSAKYGYQEVETHYTVFLGECSPEDQQTSKEISRSEYLADRALRYTLINALDVSGYRSLLGIPIEHFSDEDMLCRLHHLRAKCSLVPAEAIAESIKWIRSNESKSG